MALDKNQFQYNLPLSETETRAVTDGSVASFPVQSLFPAFQPKKVSIHQAL